MFEIQLSSNGSLQFHGKKLLATPAARSICMSPWPSDRANPTLLFVQLVSMFSLPINLSKQH